MRTLVGIVKWSGNCRNISVDKRYLEMFPGNNGSPIGIYIRVDCDASGSMYYSLLSVRKKSGK